MEKAMNIWRNWFKKRKQNFLKKPMPSISQDYYIFTAGIIFLALILTTCYVWREYTNHQVTVKQKLTTSAKVIDSELSNYLDYVAFIVEDRGHKIAQKGSDNTENIHYLLKHTFTFQKDKNGLKRKVFRWPHLSWITSENNILVDSIRGTSLAKTTLSGDHLYFASQKPWQFHISEVQYNSKTDEYYFQAAMGVFNKEKKHIGTIVTHFEIDKVIKTIDHATERSVDFVILNNNLQPIMQSEPEANIQDKNYFWSALGNIEKSEQEIDGTYILSNPISYGKNFYLAYRKSPNYPFIILTGYNPVEQNQIFYSKIIKDLLYISTIIIVIVVSLLLFHIISLAPFKRQSPLAERVLNKEYVGKIPRGYSYESITFASILIKIQLLLRSHDRMVAREKEANRQILEINKELSAQKIETEKRAEELELVKTRLEEEKRRGKRSKGIRERFVTDLRHTTRDSAGSIAQHASWLRECKVGNQPPLDFEKEVEYLQDIIEAAAKIVTNTKKVMMCSYVNICELIEQCAHNQELEAIYDDFDIEYDVQHQIPDIYIDEKILEQIVLALIYRAIEDTPKTKIKIAASKIIKNKRKYLELKVFDDGFGRTEEERRRIYSLGDNNPAHRITNGTDLELSTIEQYIQRFHGEMLFEVEPMESTLAIVLLPYQSEREAENSPLDHREDTIKITSDIPKDIKIAKLDDYRKKK